MINSSVFILLTILVSIHGVNSIIGGFIALEGEFTYSVSIWLNDKFKCAGGLITEKHILTTAICVFGKEVRQLKVKTGIQLDNPSSHFSVKRVIVPSRYPFVSDGSIDYGVDNIAVIELNSRLEWSSTISPIRLPTTNTCHGPIYEMAGWGDISAQGFPKLTNDLKWTQTFLRSRIQCVRREIPLKENEYCTSTPSTGSTACQGDDGGLLTCNETAIGIITGSTRSGPDRMTIVTLIQPYLSFIDDAIRERI